jgi:hypothetical protein
MILTFSCPFVIYAGYRALVRKSGEKIWDKAPIDWLAISGTVFVILTIAAFVILTNP